MELHDIIVQRINLSGGDAYDWPRNAHNFHGSLTDWPLFIDHFIQDHSITDILLYGDCRPYHIAAMQIATPRNVRIHVVEEGYIRPNWMTLELGGVNGNSMISKNPEWYLEQARKLPPLPKVEPVTASFKRRAHDSYWYYHHVVTGKFKFPHYRSHRPGSITLDGIGWSYKYIRNKLRPAPNKMIQAFINGQKKPFFLFPLQLSADYQIRIHSAFDDMQGATMYVIDNFKNHAPPEAHLLIKAHPLDSSFFSWSKFVKRQEEEHGLTGRLHFIDGGDLETMCSQSNGMICVNSTSATFALNAGTPVCVLGEAIYDIEGLTHRGPLDLFWSAPVPPNAELYNAFHRVLMNTCLVYGGLSSESAVAQLIDSMMLKFLPPTHSARKSKPQPRKFKSQSSTMAK